MESQQRNASTMVQVSILQKAKSRSRDRQACISYPNLDPSRPIPLLVQATACDWRVARLARGEPFCWVQTHRTVSPAETMHKEEGTHSPASLFSPINSHPLSHLVLYLQGTLLNTVFKKLNLFFVPVHSPHSTYIRTKPFATSTSTSTYLISSSN